MLNGEGGWHMSIKLLEKTTNSLPNALLASPNLHEAPSYEGALIRIRLREALARERALHRQMEALVQQQRDSLNKLSAWREEAANRLDKLSPRDHQIMELVVAGEHNKNIAVELGISQRTVENHRAAIMRKTGSKSLPELARLALAAAWTGAPDLNSAP